MYMEHINDQKVDSVTYGQITVIEAIKSLEGNHITIHSKSPHVGQLQH